MVLIIIKLLAFAGLMVSNYFLVSGFLKFCSSGDATYAERGKKQLTLGFIANVLSLITLIITSFYNDALTTTSWTMIYLTTGSFGLLLFCVFIYMSVKFIKERVKKEKRKMFFSSVLDFWLSILFISALTVFTAIQLSLIFINFNSYLM